MLKRLTPREKLEQLAATWEPVLRRAWQEAIEAVKSAVVLARIIERLERRDIDGAIHALDLDPAFFRPLDKALLDTFEGGGVATVEGMPVLRDPDGHRIAIGFNVRAPEAEAWLREHSSGLVREITADQLETARVTLTAGMERGSNPRHVALDLVGRKNRATGQRQGGSIGLTSTQAGQVENARQRLLSGDPAQIRKLLELKSRDKRFDKALRKLAEEGGTPDQSFVSKWTGQYADRLLKLRGEVIARTEAITALNRAQIAAYEQAIAKGAVDAQAVTKTWMATMDGRTRDTHMLLNGKAVGFREKFQSFSGAQLEYPGDPNAPASERINCRCTMLLKIDHLRGIK